MWGRAHIESFLGVLLFDKVVSPGSWSCRISELSL